MTGEGDGVHEVENGLVNESGMGPGGLKEELMDLWMDSKSYPKLNR